MKSETTQNKNGETIYIRKEEKSKEAKVEEEPTKQGSFADLGPMCG